MANDVRQRMVSGAAQLLARRGLAGASFAEVIALTKAPRGSVYHHFPGGKDELVAAAVRHTADYAVEMLARRAGDPAEDVAAHFLGLWRSILVDSGFTTGCSLLAVTVATDDRDLLHETAAAFGKWRSFLAEMLAAGGLSAPDAGSMAATLLCAGEGAVVLCRAERDIRTFDLVAAGLIEQVRRLTDARSGTGA